MNRFPAHPSMADRGSDALLWIGGFTCLLLPIVLLVVVVIRAIVPGGIPIWSLDVCELLMWFPTYLGLGMVWRMGRHVRVAVFVDKIPGRARLIVDLGILAVAFLVSAAMLWAGLRSCLVSWVEQRKTYSEFPEYYLSTAIPIGIGFLVYEIGMSIRTKFREFRERRG